MLFFDLDLDAKYPGWLSITALEVLARLVALSSVTSSEEKRKVLFGPKLAGFWLPSFKSVSISPGNRT